MSDSTATAGAFSLAVIVLMSPSADSTAAARPEPAEVGIVADYQPVDRSFHFTRPPDGKPVRVQIGTIVVAGDGVRLEKSDESVTVQMASGEVARFSGTGVHVVPDSRPLGTLARIFHSLPALFNDPQGLSGTAVTRNLEECGTEGYVPVMIEVPIFRSGARVVAGLHDLQFAWRGGCPPFTVQVLIGAKEIASRHSAADWHVQFEALDLPVGRYTVRISDASGRRWEGALEAFAKGPAVPADLAAETSSIGVTAKAIWIAEQDEGRWRLESLECLRPLVRSGNLLAATISDRLLFGKSPRPEE